MGPQDIGRPTEARRAPGTAQAEQRRAPHVGPQPEPVDESRVNARRGDPGGGDEEQVVHVSGCHTGLVQGACDRRRPELHGGGLPRLVPPGEGVEAAVLREWESQVPPGNLDRAVQLLEPLDVEVRPAPHLAKCGDQRLLVGVVLRQRPGHGAGARGCSPFPAIPGKL